MEIVGVLIDKSTRLQNSLHVDVEAETGNF